MRKLLFAICLLLAASPAFGATWYACGTTPTFSHVSGTTVSDVWNDADNCAGNWMNWAANPQAGDTFSANNVTGIIVDVDPKGTAAGNGKVILNTATGGTFVITTGTVTVTADIGVSGNTGTTDVLTVSGGTVTVLGNIYGGGTANADGLVISGSPTVTIGASGAGTVSITAGSASLCCGVLDSHTTSTVTVYANITGGSNATAYGYSDSGTSGLTNIIGNATGGTSGRGVYSIRSTTGQLSITGNCVASSTSASTWGCYGTNNGVIVTGNIINSAKEIGVAGSITWTPTVPASGVTGHYIQFVGGDDVFVGKNTNDATKALSTFYYIDPTDGTSDQGSASSSGGGGGAWGF